MFIFNKSKELKSLQVKYKRLKNQYETDLKWSAEALSPSVFKNGILEIDRLIEEISPNLLTSGSTRPAKISLALLEKKLTRFEIDFNNEKEKIGKQPGFHRGMTRIELKKIEQDIKTIYMDTLFTLDSKDALDVKKVYHNYLKHLAFLTEETYDPKVTSYNYFKVEMEKIKLDSLDYINNLNNSNQTV